MHTPIAEAARDKEHHARTEEDRIFEQIAGEGLAAPGSAVRKTIGKQSGQANKSTGTAQKVVYTYKGKGKGKTCWNC